jgi:hypothetical protein
VLEPGLLAEATSDLGASQPSSDQAAHLKCRVRRLSVARCCRSACSTSCPYARVLVVDPRRSMVASLSRAVQGVPDRHLAPTGMLSSMG